MKKILGLDLGTTSIGWAFVNEAESNDERSSIVRLGVRVIPLTTDEENDFAKGKAISINADRTIKRGMRRNFDRFQLRRDALIRILRNNGFVTNNTLLNEDGKNTTFLTYKLRAKAVKEKIGKEDFAKVLLMINKKRGYKSSRKVKDDDGAAIDGMDIAKFLYENNLTPGQYVLKMLKDGKRHIPDFYRSDLQNEFEKVWDFQQQFYPEILTEEFKEQIKDKGKQATAKIFLGKYGIYTAENKGKRDEVKLQAYNWRNQAISQQLTIEKVAYVISEINNNIDASSGYLGAISDRSKELFFNKQTVGEYLYAQLKQNPHTNLKNQVFYRQDYLDEFEKIWEMQKHFYPELNNKLKKKIRDEIIFYQRRLKSQKHLISNCEFEKYHKTIPKSSPLFQEFKIWQILNNLELRNTNTKERFYLNQRLKELLFNELNIKNKLSNTEVLKLVVDKPNEYELNYKEVEGNRTNAELYKAYQKILELEGEEFDFSKMRSDRINEEVSTKFLELGINTDIMFFNSEIDGNDFDKQPIIQLWHLLYSFEGDNSRSGIETLLEKLKSKFGFKREYAKLIANVSLQADYGSLSARAIRKILPSLKEGKPYDVACKDAGYNHSFSLTKEELANRELKDKLELLPKNSLRNPVVEKILNQLVNVINAIIDDKSLGKPDEIRIELARELKKSAKERKEAKKRIDKATIEHEKIRKILHSDFAISKVTRNDIIRYKLWKELERNGYKTIYTNTYIPKEELFSKKFDIEHIIPQAKLFDDSFSNKTLSVRQVNIDKGNKTAYDYLEESLNAEEFNQYLERIEKMFKDKVISKAKLNKLKMKSSEIPDGFIERDLRNSQYIAKKAKQMLEEVVRTVNTTTGAITDRLRSDWQLINIMKELNLPKYEKLGLVETIEGKNGQDEIRIKDWTKRNDHRHHAMDALTVAFTSYSHVQYLNNLSARNNEAHNKFQEVYGIEQKYLHRDKNNKLLFNSPIPVAEFRSEAKKHLESILISFKAKNKVVTRNKNKTKLKGKDNFKEKIELTPRGQLHIETVYGKIERYKTKLEKVGPKFDLQKIKQVAKQSYRVALLIRLAEFNGEPKKAFGGKNSLAKYPIYLDEAKTIKVPEKVKLVWKEDNYTKRVIISPDLFKDSKKKDDFINRVENIYDKGIKQALKDRYEKIKINVDKLNETITKASEKKKVLEMAFANLEKNPIWLNKEKGICIKRVTVSGVSNAEALHYKKDHNGKFIFDENGNKQAVDFVSTGNNHHVAIYRDEKGNLKDDVVSFFKAVERRRQGLSIIDKSLNSELGWEFLFTMKQNECFVFPSDGFDPSEIDLLNPKNTSLISPHLFRVQKLSKVMYGNSVVRDYVFRHHLETRLIDKKETKDITYIVAKSLPKLEGIVKVRINHLGQIVKVGE